MKKITTLYLVKKEFKQFQNNCNNEDLSASQVINSIIKEINETPDRLRRLFFK